MRFRRVELTSGGCSAAVWDDDRSRWLPLAPALASGGEQPSSLAPLTDDVVGLLAGGTEIRDALARLLAASGDREFDGDFTLAPLLPFQPRLLRAFANSERHWIQAAHGLVRINLPRALPFIRLVEAVTRKPFRAFRPGKLFYEQPAFYLGNALTIVSDGSEAPWPGYTRYLDFEIELAAVIVRPLHNATQQQARDAIGGFVVFNDFSARDTQWRELRDGLFGPVIKTKSFAGAISAEVVSADEIWPRVDELSAELWSRTGTHEMQWDFGEMAAFASDGERVFAGELLSAGTLPDGCGLELNRWLKPGDRIELRIDGVGSVSNTIGEPQPRSADLKEETSNR
jgi:2-keto-4-pentenoate hydratase/2-oxohepta-3-ene-1,7-dioic acid hydratase in catechol pathway